MGIKIFSNNDPDYLPNPFTTQEQFSYVVNNGNKASDNNWNPDYSKMLDDFRISQKRGNDSDPLKRFYDASVDMANQKISDNQDHGKYEFTDLVDQNFQNFIDEASNNQDFLNQNPDLNLEDYKDKKPFGKSAGQLYRDRYITANNENENTIDKTIPGVSEDVISGLNQGLNQGNYVIGKALSDAIRSIPNDDNSPFKDIVNVVQNAASPDALMTIPSVIEDMTIAPALGAVGGAIGGAVSGAPAGGVGAIPGSALGSLIGSTGGTFVKNFIENQNDLKAADMGIDPITGNKLSDDEINDLRDSATLNIGMGTALGMLGGGALKAAPKSLEKIFPKTLYSDAMKTIAKDTTEEASKYITDPRKFAKTRSMASAIKSGVKSDEGFIKPVAESLKGTEWENIPIGLKSAKDTAVNIPKSVKNTIVNLPSNIKNLSSKDIKRGFINVGKSIAKGTGNLLNKGVFKKGLEYGPALVNAQKSLTSYVPAATGVRLLEKSVGSKIGPKLSNALLKPEIFKPVRELNALPNPRFLDTATQATKNFKIATNQSPNDIKNRSNFTISTDIPDESIYHDRAYKLKSRFEPNDTKWINYKLQRKNN